MFHIVNQYHEINIIKLENICPLKKIKRIVCRFYLDPCWSWENSTMWPTRSRSWRLGKRLFRKSSNSLLRPEGMISDLLYRRREGGNSWLLELNRLVEPVPLRLLASAPGAAEMNRPLPFVSPPAVKIYEATYKSDHFQYDWLAWKSKFYSNGI